jgi:hypothetical protein
VSFDFGYCSLAQEMSFVDCYLPYFRQQLITCLLWALLPFKPLFTENLCGDLLLALPPFSGALTAPCSLCCVLVFSSYLLFSFFLWGMVSVYAGGYAGLSQALLWEYRLMLGAHLLVCRMSPK